MRSINGLGDLIGEIAFTVQLNQCSLIQYAHATHFSRLPKHFLGFSFVIHIRFACFLVHFNLQTRNDAYVQCAFEIKHYIKYTNTIYNPLRYAVGVDGGCG